LEEKLQVSVQRRSSDFPQSSFETMLAVFQRTAYLIAGL